MELRQAVALFKIYAPFETRQAQIAEGLIECDDALMTKVALIIAADEPALFFASVNQAQVHLEAIDVRDGVYSAAFGPNGEPYSISTDGERVIIRATGDRPQPEALKALLLRYFDAIGEKPKEGSSLSSLLERCTPLTVGEGSAGLSAALSIGLPLLLMLIAFLALK